MERPPAGRTTRALLGLPLVLAAGYIALYVVLACLRIGYPFELEWEEGGAVDHVRRVLAGEGLYVEPSLEFIPYIYTPLYFWVSALFARVLGVGFLALRSVSFLSSLASLALLFELARRETGSRRAGLLASGFFAATYRLGGAWFDVARVDSLFLALLLGGVLALRVATRSRGLALAGLLFALSFLAKQTALVVALPLCVHACTRHAGLARFVFPATLAALAGSCVLLLDGASDGWFSYYVFEVPRAHDLLERRLATFWTEDLLPVALAVLAAGALLAGLARARRWNDLSFHACLLAGLVGAAWSSRMHRGGYDNVLVPAFAALALGFGVSAWRWIESHGGVRRALVLGLCSVQLAALAYDPRGQVPTAEDEAAGREFLALLASYPGEVFVPYHGFLPSLAGKRTFAQGMAFFDVVRADRPDSNGGRGVMQRVAAQLEQRAIPVIVLDEEWDMPLIRERYRRTGKVFERPDVFWPVTGMRARPTWIYQLEAGPPGEGEPGR